MHWITILALGGLALASPESPFACNPGALAPTERTRHFDQVAPKLRALVRRSRELPDGYVFEFARGPATERMLAQWAVEESACCPFFDVEVRMARESGPVELRLTGREGVKAFIREEFPAGWFAGARASTGAADAGRAGREGRVER